MLVGGVVPGQIQQRPVPLVGRAGQPLPDPLAEFVEELQFALALSRRLDGLVPPLHQSLCLREGSGLLHVRGGGQEEHLGLDLLGFQFPGGDFGPVLPPGGRFDQVEVAHHQPLEMRHAQPLHPAVRRTDRGVLAEQEVALDLVGQHAHHGLVGAVRAGQSGQVVVGPVVVRGGRLAPPRLEQADGVGVGVGPEALLFLGSHRGQVVGQGVVHARLGHRQIAGQQVEQRGDVGGALDGGVAAQRHDAAARAPDVAHQQLQNRCGADELGAQGVLRPADGVGEAGGALAPGVLHDGAGQVVEVLPADPAHVFDHLRRVAGVVPLEDLEDGPRVLQGLVAAHPGVRQRRARCRARHRRRCGWRWRRGCDRRRGTRFRLRTGRRPPLRRPNSTCRTARSRDRTRRTGRRDPRCRGSFR